MKAAKYGAYRQMGRLIPMSFFWLLTFFLVSFSTFDSANSAFGADGRTLGGNRTAFEIDGESFSVDDTSFDSGKHPSGRNVQTGNPDHPTFRATKTRNGAPFTVVLDAGHGGHDPGNLGNGYLEKNIALNIVLKAGEILEKHPDIKVIYTRKDDTFVDLYVRGEIANKAGADLFVSVHCDSHTSRAQGAGTFVLGLHANEQNFEIAKKENSVIYLEDDYKSRYADYDINSPQSVIGLTIMQEEFLDQSIALAKAIQDEFTDLKRIDRKVKQAGFIVLHQTIMPSVLVETGFLTNKEEGAFLNSKKGQADMGTAIAEAILQYKEDVSANIADSGIDVMARTPEPSRNDSAAGDTASSENDTSDRDGTLDRKKSRKERKREREAATNTTGEVAASASSEVEEVVLPSATGREGASASKERGTSISASEEKEKDMGTAQGGDTESPNTSGKDTAQIIEEANARSASTNKERAEKQRPGEVVVTANPAIAANKEGGTEEQRPGEVVVAANPAIAPGKEGDAEKGNTSNIIYKVQIMASEKDIPLRPQSFNGLNRVVKEPYNNLYRYVYGSTTSIEEAKMMKRNADMKGYPTSFIAVYRDGKRLSFKEMKQHIEGQ